MLSANKAVFAAFLYELQSPNIREPPEFVQDDISIVLDGGSLIQSLPWTNGNCFLIYYANIMFSTLNRIINLINVRLCSMGTRIFQQPNVMPTLSVQKHRSPTLR